MKSEKCYEYKKGGVVVAWAVESWIEIGDSAEPTYSIHTIALDGSTRTVAENLASAPSAADVKDAWLSQEYEAGMEIDHLYVEAKFPLSEMPVWTQGDEPAGVEYELIASDGRFTRSHKLSVERINAMCTGVDWVEDEDEGEGVVIARSYRTSLVLDAEAAKFLNECDNGRQ